MDPYRAELEPLHPEEAGGLERAIEARRLEFTAGRHCARLVLRALGVPPSPVRRGEDRAPIWPAGVVGAITHSRAGNQGFCAAAAARSADAFAVGLDAELDAPLEESLFRRVLTDAERRHFATLAEGERGTLAKIVFSAKECVYKCQYPASRQFLEFGDVEVDLDVASGTFVGRLLRDALPFRTGHELAGRFLRESGVIVTAITLRQNPSATSQSEVAPSPPHRFPRA